MAMFDRTAEKRRDEGAATETTLSVIGLGMTVRGDIMCTGVIKIEGTIEGSLRGARQVLLGRQGLVRGDISAREAVIGGTVEGSVTADERVEIQATSIVNGDITTKIIQVAEGGQINGAVRVSSTEAKPEAKEGVAAPASQAPRAVSVVR
jgi:cytoskeletal protein CcmA (bactofilin family)